uniref:Wall-associated receptor kinase-like 16 n=1 Tax=Ananas comosus var. bracteatus TaxID=296719 RepID=A0A6V7QKP6_ANACO|nr:unnamed protein product [Ananas comosus var. bracteatus]
MCHEGASSLATDRRPIKNEEDKELIEEVAELARACLNVRGEERPTMKEVAEELKRLRKLKQHSWEQNPEEMKSLLGESRKYHAEEKISTYFSLEKKGVLSIGR